MYSIITPTTTRPVGVHLNARLFNFFEEHCDGFFCAVFNGRGLTQLFQTAKLFFH